MKRLLITLILLSNLLFASNDFIEPYIGTSSYSSESSRDKEKIFGLKGNIYYSDYFFEYGVQHSSITGVYKENRNSIALIYNKSIGFNFLGRTGINFINISDNPKLKSAKVFILGAKEFKEESYEIGLNFYYSKYKAKSNFNIMQFSPFIGFYFPYLKGVINLKVTYNITSYNMSTSSIKELNLMNNRLLNLSLSYLYKNFITTFDINVAGKEQYLVKEGGLSLESSSDIYKNSMGLSLEYKIGDNYSIKGRAKIYEFTDENNNNVAIKNNFGIGLKISF